MAQFTIRVPDEMQARIKAVAHDEKRSMNGQIEWLLGFALDMRDKMAAEGFLRARGNKEER
jgi:hypothetical protein